MKIKFNSVTAEQHSTRRRLFSPANWTEVYERN
jgi:hypothetical protein